MPEFDVQVESVRTVFQALPRDSDALVNTVCVAQEIRQQAREIRIGGVEFKSGPQLALDRLDIAARSQQTAELGVIGGMIGIDRDRMSGGDDRFLTAV